MGNEDAPPKVIRVQAYLRTLSLCQKQFFAVICDAGAFPFHSIIKTLSQSKNPENSPLARNPFCFFLSADAAPSEVDFSEEKYKNPPPQRLPTYHFLKNSLFYCYQEIEFECYLTDTLDFYNDC